MRGCINKNKLRKAIFYVSEPVSEYRMKSKPRKV